MLKNSIIAREPIWEVVGWENCISLNVRLRRRQGAQCRDGMMWSGAARGAPRACANGRTLVIRRRMPIITRATLSVAAYARHIYFQLESAV